MVEIERREHERIEIRMPTRMWIDETRNGRPIQFEGHAESRDLSIGGTFIRSDYLLPIGFPINLDMSLSDGDVLSARAEVVHRVEPGEEEEIGMGLIFTLVDARNRERLLRFFVSDRIREFYEQRFVVEFPHLGETMSMKDVALVVNLWEDKEGRIASLHTPSFVAGKQAVREEEVRAAKRRGGGDKSSGG